MKLTEPAITKITEQIEINKNIMEEPNLFLRITVVENDCCGLKHQTYFDNEVREDDILLRFQGFDLRIDKESHPHLKGATLEYFDTLEKQGFFLDNPNGKDSCECNSSK